MVYEIINHWLKDGIVKDNDDITKIRGIITIKSFAALSDNPKSIRSQTLTTAKLHGLTKSTKLTSICNETTNCLSVINSLSDEC